MNLENLDKGSYLGVEVERGLYCSASLGASAYKSLGVYKFLLPYVIWVLKFTAAFVYKLANV